MIYKTTDITLRLLASTRVILAVRTTGFVMGRFWTALVERSTVISISSIIARSNTHIRPPPLFIIISSHLLLTIPLKSGFSFSPTLFIYIFIEIQIKGKQVASILFIF